jgi:hypothetical protein
MDRYASITRRAVLGFALILGGCATSLPSPEIVTTFDRAAASSLLAAAVQVQRCYRAPRVPHGGRQIATRLRVRFTPEGTLAALPAIVWQSGVTPDNQRYAKAMGEAAILSVMRCSPLHLPAELYARGWDEFDLTFSPRAAV